MNEKSKKKGAADIWEKLILKRKPCSENAETLSDGWYSVILMLPALAVLLFFGIFPLIYAINLSLAQADLTSAGNNLYDFVGLRNFRYALTNDVFRDSLWRTVLFSIATVSIEIVLGVWIAFILNKLKWFKGIIRALFLIPLACAPAAIGMIWRYMFDSEFGIINALLNMVGLGTVNWMGNAVFAFWAIVIMDIWQWTPFVMLITLTALQTLPKEPLEAAQLDGASNFRVLRKLTFPMISPMLFLVILMRFMDSARLYDPIQATTRGGPGTATETVTYLLYRVGLKQFRMDYASAMSLIIWYLIIVTTSFVLKRILKNQGKHARSE